MASSPVPTREMIRQRVMPAINSAGTGWMVTITASAFRTASLASGVSNVPVWTTSASMARSTSFSISISPNPG